MFRWLVEEGEIPTDPMTNVKAPRVIVRPIPILEPCAIRMLLDDCRGTDFTSRRDEALIRLLLDTGLRLGELSRV